MAFPIDAADRTGALMRRVLYLGWVYAVIGVWTLLVFPSSLLITLLTGSHRIGHRVHARFWGRMILRCCCIRLRVHGGERLQPTQAYVLMINHNSHFAGYAVAAGLPLQWRAVLASKLRKIPVFSWIALLAGHVFIDTRNTPHAIATLNTAADKIRGGLSVLIFPEGRHHDGARLLPFRPGGFHLALRAGVPVVPLLARERCAAGPTGIVRQIDLYVDTPLPTVGKTASDIPALVQQTWTAMNRHLANTTPIS